ncbi:MAG: YadA-like family protein [Alphaproteobacteria bacterium]|nr:YadA-like family protein [Alphaproteobacteria bacterium]
MKYSNTAIKELTARYRAVLKKCALIAFALVVGAGTAVADVSVTGETVYGGADATATVTDKETAVTTAREGQDLANQINTNTTNIGTLQTAVAGKADSATTLAGYGITDAYTKTETDSAINNAINELTTNGQVATNSADIGTLQTLVAEKADSATTLAGYGITDAYTKTETDSAITTAVDTLANGQVATNTTNISANATDIATNTTEIENIKDVLGTTGDGEYVSATATVGDNLGALDTQVAKNTGAIGTTSDGAYIGSTSTIGENLNALDTQVEANTDAIGTTGDGNYIAATDTIGDNLGTLDTQVKLNADNISANANDIDTIKTNIGDVNNISGSYVANTKDIVTNLNDLDSQVTTNTANIGTVSNINSVTGDTVTAATVSDAIGEIDTKLGTFADVSGDYVDGTKTIAENLNSLNNAIGSKADISGGTYNSANGLVDTNTVNQNLTALSNAIGDKTALSSGADNITGTTVVGAINDLDAKIGNDSEMVNTYNGVETSNTIKANINAVNTAIGDLEQVGNNVDSNGKTITGNLAAPGSSVVDNLNALDARLGQIDGLANAIEQNGGTYYGNLAGGSTVADHLVELDAAIGNLKETGVRGENIAAQLQTLGNDLQNLENEVRGGFAASAALSALVPNARATNDTQISLGTGMYRDRAGFAIGAFHYVNDNVLLNAGAAYGGSKSTTVKAGITFGW